MAKKRPGIFDPWRQEQPDAPPPLEPQVVSAGDELAEDAVPRPVRFAGKRGGVTVTVVGTPGPALVKQAQTNLLAAITRLFQNKVLQPLFEERGITLSRRAGAAMETIISDGSRTVVVNTDYLGAIDAITFVLRDVIRTDDRHRQYLMSLGIRPYIV